MSSSPIELHLSRETAFGGPSTRSRQLFVRVRAGVYARRFEWERLAPWERYLARVHAYALVAPEAIFAYESAAALRGLPLFGEPRDIQTTQRLRSTRKGDVSTRTWFLDDSGGAGMGLRSDQRGRTHCTPRLQP